MPHCSGWGEARRPAAQCRLSPRNASMLMTCAALTTAGSAAGREGAFKPKILLIKMSRQAPELEAANALGK